MKPVPPYGSQLVVEDIARAFASRADFDTCLRPWRSLSSNLRRTVERAVETRQRWLLVCHRRGTGRAFARALEYDAPLTPCSSPPMIGVDGADAGAPRGRVRSRPAGARSGLVRARPACIAGRCVPCETAPGMAPDIDVGGRRGPDGHVAWTAPRFASTGPICVHCFALRTSPATVGPVTIAGNVHLPRFGTGRRPPATGS